MEIRNLPPVRTATDCPGESHSCTSFILMLILWSRWGCFNMSLSCKSGRGKSKFYHRRRVFLFHLKIINLLYLSSLPSEQLLAAWEVTTSKDNCQAWQQVSTSLIQITNENLKKGRAVHCFSLRGAHSIPKNQCKLFSVISFHINSLPASGLIFKI